MMLRVRHSPLPCLALLAVAALPSLAQDSRREAPGPAAQGTSQPAAGQAGVDDRERGSHNDPGAALGRAAADLLSRFGPTLAVVRIGLETEDGKRVEFNLAGVTVHASGLTLVPADESLLSYPRSYLKRIEIIRPEKADDPIEARLIAANDLVGALFVEPVIKATSQPCVDFSAAAHEIRIGQTLVGVALLGPGLGHRCSFELYRAGPRVGEEGFVVIGSRPDGMALLLFDTSGRLVGLARSPTGPEQDDLFAEVAPELGFIEQPTAARATVFEQAVAFAIRERRDWPEPWMGVAGLSVADRDICEAYKLPHDTTAIIVGAVVDGFPAAAAGLKPKDFIIALNARPLPRGSTEEETLSLFTRQLKRMNVGDAIELTIWRDEARKPVALKLSEAPKPVARADREFNSVLGLSAREIVFSDRFGRRLEPTQTGVVAAYLVQSGPADTAELSVGDIIQKIDDAPVPDLATYRKVIAEKLASKPDELIVRVLRGSSEQLILRVELQPSKPDQDSNKSGAADAPDSATPEEDGN